ncbi:MAG: hypothetical protein JJE04_01980 [Acidobacteriia bacterium]|nr:hypothetical protein [Terriglobia bacterium]
MRRISVGLSVPVLVFYPVANGSLRQDVNSTLQVNSNTITTGHRLGLGAVVQLALPRQFALAGSLSLRRVAFNATKNTFTGVDNPNTAADERKLTTDDESTKARHWDLTVLVRRYNKEHWEKGRRWFFELGAAGRRTNKIQTSVATTAGGETVCCNTTPHEVANKLARGVVGGVGLHFTDEIGVRFVPEFRYTRWLNRSFDNLSTRSRRDQFEAVISFTF